MKRNGIFALGGVLTLAAAGMVIAASNSADARQSTAGAVKSGASAEAPVVLELFTSQGCSSCPPADRLAARLALDPSFLVISRPVTYWDRLGWKDTLALPANTDLQRAYARKGNEGAGVYTPQIVVDGRHGAVGSNARNVQALSMDAAMVAKPDLTTSRSPDGSVIVTIRGKVQGQSELVLLALSSRESVQIGRGENGGRRVSYTNVLRKETPVGSLSRSNQRFKITPEMMQVSNANRYAIILRKPNAGPILAGRMIAS